MADISASLPDQLKEYVTNQISIGRYSSASDMLRDLIRRDQSYVQWMENRILEGLESGDPVEVTPEFFADKKARLLAKGKK